MKKALDKYDPANVEDATGSEATSGKDDDDNDLLGSEEEEESKAKRLKEHLSLYQSKKAKDLSLLPSLPSY